MNGPRAPRIVLGPALWIFGALLWCYAILGQFVVRDFPEGFALVTLALVVGIAYRVAVRDGLAALPSEPAARKRRWLWPGVVAFGFWLATTILVTLVGKSAAQNLDKPITLGLMLLSALAIIFGRSFTHPDRPRRTLTRLAVSVACWVGAIFATLVALAVGS